MHADPSAPNCPRSTFPGLMLLSAATLLLEVCLTRVLSVSLWYHFAFMVVSTALFGLGFAGVALSLRRRPEEVSTRLLAWAAVGTPLAFVVGFGLFQIVPFEPFSLGKDGMQWLYLPLAYLAVTLPFFFAGTTIAGLLTRHAEFVHRLYRYDLLGAGLGSLAVIWLLPALGGSGTVVMAAALAAVGAAFVAVEHDRRLVYVSAVLAVLLGVSSLWAEVWLPVRISSNKVVAGGKPVGEVLADPQYHMHTAWNTLSRIDVVRFRDAAGRERRSVLIDAGTALTRLAHPERPIDKLGPTISEESFFIRYFDSPEVLIVGSGGGREVLMALRNGAAKITGVEINPAINELLTDRMTDFTGGLAAHPKVEIVTDEARSYLRRQTRRWHIIECPHTISNAAMASGSLSLAENHLMTIEAFVDYYERLEDDGILIITRPEAHMARLFGTARALWDKLGRKDISDCVLSWKARSRGRAFYAGFALSKKPFAPDDVDRFRQVLKRRSLEVLYLPGGEGEVPYPKLISADDPTKVVLLHPAIVTPATDDAPFFNRRVPLSDISLRDMMGVFSPQAGGRMALEERPVAESALLVLLLETVFIGLLFIVLPLWIFRRRAMAGEGRLRTLGAFGLLGLAYIVVEVGFIQRFNLYLGRPVVVFATVLGVLLVASGIGAGFAKRFSHGRAATFACLVAGVAAAIAAGMAWLLLDWTLAWPAAARVVLAALLLFPVGFVMGMPFPILVSRLQKTYPERIPWAWGVNGFASVVGSVGAVVLGMTLGFTAVLFVGVACYFVAALFSLGSDPSF